MNRNTPTSDHRPGQSHVASILSWLVAAGHLFFAGVGALFAYIEPQTPGPGWLFFLILLANGSLFVLAGFRVRVDPMPWPRAIRLGVCWGVPSAVGLFLLKLVENAIPETVQAVGLALGISYLVSAIIYRSWRVLESTFFATWSAYFAAMSLFAIIVTTWYIVTGTPLVKH